MQALEISAPVADPPACEDYARIRAALEFIGAQAKRQPQVEEIAAHVGLSASHLHHLFQRWAGITPKAFLQAVTIDHARRLLRDNASLLDASLELGLSGPARLHDLFVTQEMMTPGEFKAGGAGLDFAYGFHPSPFGEALAVVAPRGLAGLGFVDEAGREAALADMRRRWPKALFHEDDGATAPYVRRAFDPALWRPDQPLRVVLIGSDFEMQVWRALLKIPLGAARTYSDVAGDIGRPSAARAVGAAVGRNPISFVVPCHRVLGRSGALTGYHWGLVRKQAIIGWEAGRTGPA
jgi:AraC family transcriptional regulator of adaptative response/methylated-DNA-[protein]-cysteine methyltransferase